MAYFTRQELLDIQVFEFSPHGLSIGGEECRAIGLKNHVTPKTVADIGNQLFSQRCAGCEDQHAADFGKTACKDGNDAGFTGAGREFDECSFLLLWPFGNRFVTIQVGDDGRDRSSLVFPQMWRAFRAIPKIVAPKMPDGLLKGTIINSLLLYRCSPILYEFP